MSDAHAVAIALGCVHVGRHDEARALLLEFAQPLGRLGYGLYDQIQCMVQARLADACGEDVEPWIQRLAGLPEGPAFVMAHRRLLLASLQALSLPDTEELVVDLRARGQMAMVRSAEIAAARIAMAAGAHVTAAMHARAALQLSAVVDPWSDEPASVWWVASQALAACGAVDEARTALVQGAHWVEQGAFQWTDPAHRKAWCEGNPVHRALLDQASATAG